MSTPEIIIIAAIVITLIVKLARRRGPRVTQIDRVVHREAREPEDGNA